MNNFIIKLLLLTIICTISISNAFSSFNKKLPQNFKIECYEFISELKNLQKNTYLINSSKKIDTFISDNKIIENKIYKNFWENIDYKINLIWNKNYLTDNNNKTFLEIDTQKNKEIIIEFDKILKANFYNFEFLYQSNFYQLYYYISEDWINYSKVSNIDNFQIKFVKILFYNKNNLREKIKITELSFKSKNYTYLINAEKNIKAYSNNICKNNFPNLENNSNSFFLNKNTKTIKLNLEKNPQFNVYKKDDLDKDWVNNSQDNCINIHNPYQKDSNWDWIWDLCADDDFDWIIWAKDNCVYIANKNQKDINRNWIWDICEFDKDFDKIFDSKDNCINVVNPLQKDDDFDWIWNKCDNSIYYNPTQLDKNNNGIWDITEQKQKELKQNDKDFDGILNTNDNCIDISNKDQYDSDNDWIWNSCDNCKNIQNTNQLDFNKNNIWDVCEDSDNDWIDWLSDNCINIPNPLQKDDDNNGIWNKCEDSDNDKILFINDNCPYKYNPDQKNIDNDKLWDICDIDDNRFIESNSTFFIWIMILIVILFWGGIFVMVRKLK